MAGQFSWSAAQNLMVISSIRAANGQATLVVAHHLPRAGRGSIMDTTASRAAVRQIAVEVRPAAPKPPSARVLPRWRTPAPSLLAAIRRGCQCLRIRYLEAGTRRAPGASIRLGLDLNYQYRVPSCLYLPPSLWRRIG
jgi:hypothetical protein